MVTRRVGSILVSGLAVVCAAIATATDEAADLPTAEKNVAAASLNFPDVNLASQAQTVAVSSPDAAMKKRAKRLLEQIESARITGDYHKGEKSGLWAQVIAMGNRTYQANILMKIEPKPVVMAVLTGKASDGVVRLSGTFKAGRYKGSRAVARISDFKLTMTVHSNPAIVATMEKLAVLPQSLGMAAPNGAVVLVDGSGLNAWNRLRGGRPKWRMVRGDAVEVVPGSGGLVSKRSFGDHRIHVEFRTPLMPEARGQDRGNSGVYVHGRYEVQVLDSYGLTGRDNDCGGVYKVAAPRVNACGPPLIWQTYDIEFTAPRLIDGKVVQPARMTVWHNGVKIHEKLVIKRPTGAAPLKGVEGTGPLFLQDHNNAVQYRNVWVVDKTAAASKRVQPADR